ncbi:MAG: lamin tail domain-containing protein [Elusimicrobia bacterium]|nr:lamin tail domain-containing protein [Elusimicrobiota bacterium]
MFRSAGVLLALFFPFLLFASVQINEVAFDEPSGTPDWVELFNAGTSPVLLDGFVLDDGDTGSGKYILLSTGLTLPPQGYLVVYVDAMGVSDRDLSDGFGAVYSGTATTVNLAVTEDQVALYSGVPLSSATVVDYVSWVTDGDYGGVSDRTQVAANAAGLWPADGAVEMRDGGSGYSLGRRRNGVGNGPMAFQAFLHPTRGESNEPSPSPFSSALTVDPACRAFSPFDADPAFQRTRFYFNASVTAVKTLRVLDIRGRVVRTLMESDHEIGGVDFAGMATGSVLWDGRDDGGTVVPLGLYLALFEAADPGSGSTQRSHAQVAVGRPR